jgi:rhodanese-related sulfurtransferase
MREVTVTDLAAALAEGANVVDVRESAEYAEGHVPGAVPIPMGHLPARTTELDRTQPVYVICASGNRSAAMTDYLAAAGFDAASVAGGTNAWAREGRPIERA